ncbi:hypothetical protein [Burkholderia ubonensis]|uniref:hypothetical protein n=1 Tax=Burkholderia ubonensis TaxID=101571 RepID=UPI000A49D26E|nr:hypothetical protein [Burkholderia ubonensis]
MMFKNGDKVRSLTDGGWGAGKLRGPKVGGVYTIEKVKGTYVQLREFMKSDPGHWRYVGSYAPVEDAKAEFDLLSAMTGKPLKFRSGCDVKFIAYSLEAKPHCQLVLLNPSTGNIVTRYANGKASDEPHNDPGDILVKEAA